MKENKVIDYLLTVFLYSKWVNKIKLLKLIIFNSNLFLPVCFHDDVFSEGLSLL